jgi:hypothetical protein
MNGVRLLDLAVAVSPMMPSATAIPHAGLEWKAARIAWIAALNELGLTEEKARDLASRRIHTPASERFS